MNIEILNAELVCPLALVACVPRLLQHGGGTLHVYKRAETGWLEYLLVCPSITIGMVQRTEGAPYEFHS
jgi:hypothetical protein